MVFVIITNQSWMEIMLDHIRALDNLYVSFYFLLIIIIGDFLLLNLFLAILINNFGEHSERIQQKNKNEQNEKGNLNVFSFFNSFKKNRVSPEKVNFMIFT